MAYISDTVYLEIEPVYGTYSYNRDELQGLKTTSMRRTRPSQGLFIEVKLQVDKDLFLRSLSTTLKVDVEQDIQIAQIVAVPKAVVEEEETS